MLFASISLLFLLLHCAPHEVTAGSNAPKTSETTTATSPETTTATSPETTTATTPETTTATTPETTTATTPETTTPETTLSPEYDCCDTFIATDAPATPLIPSAEFVIRASCACNTENKTFCPEVVVGEEAKELVFYSENIVEDKQNSCVVVVTIKPVLNKFLKRSIKVPLTVFEIRTPHSRNVRFQKSENNEMCNEDVDCWRSWDQICDNHLCSCYQDVPVFIGMEDHCLPASKYGQICKYDQQCMASDNHTICGEEHKKCICKKDYWIHSDSDPTCITSFSAKVIANQFMVYFTAISSVILISRMM